MVRLKTGACVLGFCHIFFIRNDIFRYLHRLLIRTKLEQGSSTRSKDSDSEDKTIHQLVEHLCEQSRIMQDIFHDEGHYQNLGIRLLPAGTSRVGRC